MTGRPRHALLACALAACARHDSADVGYVFADPLGRWRDVYGVRTASDLLRYTREFGRSGSCAPD